MKTNIKKLKGANMDIDLTTNEDKISWKQDKCPWNQAEKIPARRGSSLRGTKKHKCAIKNVSICDYFCGIEDVDTVMCSYPNKKK